MFPAKSDQSLSNSFFNAQLRVIFIFAFCGVIFANFLLSLMKSIVDIEEVSAAGGGRPTMEDASPASISRDHRKTGEKTAGGSQNQLEEGSILD